MHRTENSLTPSQPAARSPLDIQSALFSTSTGDTASALFAPLHYEPGYAYPLIIWLHGRGADERQLLRIMPLVSMRNYVAAAPRGLELPADNADEKPSLGWTQSVQGIQEAEQRVFDAVAMAGRKLHVAEHRVFLAGAGCGGTMAFRLAMNHPHRFAGVLSFCGPFPRERNPLGRLTQVRRLPVLLAVGRDSREYPSEEVCDNLRLFHTAGLSTTLRQYPGGDDLAPQMLADMDRWVIEQISAPGPVGDD